MDPQTAFYIAQGISVITGVLAVVTMQFKNMKTVLIFQIIVNFTALSNYLLLGGDSGVFVSLLAIVQSIVMFLYNRKGQKPQLMVVALFILAYVGSSVYNIYVTKQLLELLPAGAAICFSISLAQEKASSFRVWGALNPTFWLGYDLYTRSYVMFLVHFGILVSSVVGMIRLDGVLSRKQK